MQFSDADDFLCCRDSIAICSLPEKDMANVSRKFAVEFAHDLSCQWKLFDPFGKLHLVSYEGNSEEPYLFQGLMEIRKFYSLQGMNWFLLKFQGFSNFDLFIYTDNFEEVCYLTRSLPQSMNPTSNSKILSQGQCSTVAKDVTEEWIFYPCFFTSRLSTNQVSSSQLNLPVHVYEYLLQGEVYNWTLRGPTGNEVDCKILGVPHRNYARFGKGWRAFCTTHELKEGDMLTFFFTSEKFGFVDVLIHSETCNLDAI